MINQGHFMTEVIRPRFNNAEADAFTVSSNKVISYYETENGVDVLKYKLDFKSRITQLAAANLGYSFNDCIIELIN